MRKLDLEHKNLVEKNIDILTSIAVNGVYLTPSFLALTELASAYVYIGYPQPNIRCSNCVAEMATRLYSYYQNQLKDEEKEVKEKKEETPKGNVKQPVNKTRHAQNNKILTD